MLVRLSSPFTTLALLSVCMQINLSGKQYEWRLPNVGLFYKLLLAPFSIYLLYKYVFDQNQLITTISVMGSAIGPMNTAAVIAGKYDINLKI